MFHSRPLAVLPSATLRDKRDRKHRVATQPGTRAGWFARLCERAQRRTAKLYHVGTQTIINAEKF
jgi:hypothetical protein